MTPRSHVPDAAWSATPRQHMPLTQVGQAGFHQDMEKRAGVSLVVFTQVSCGACRALKTVPDDAAPSPVAHLLEVDALDAAALTAEYDVFHLPAMFVFVHGVFQGPLVAFELAPPQTNRPRIGKGQGIAGVAGRHDAVK